VSRRKHRQEYVRQQAVGLELTSPSISVTSYAALGVERPDIEELELSPVQVQLHDDNGLPLLKALQESTFLYRACRRYTATSMLVTDGIRFWTSDLNFNGMYTEELSLPIRQCDPVWRPVVGSLTGWRLG
jgi:hypothetical protein